LGIDENSSLTEIKEAYRKLSKKFHPDLNQNDNYFESRFKEIQEAYEILSDPTKRRRYDAALTAFKSGMATGTPKKARNKTIWIDVLFTLVLISITLVFGAYVKKAMSSSVINEPNMLATANPAPLIIAKHHKKKHTFTLKSVQPIIEVDPAVTTVRQVQPVAVTHISPVQSPVVVIRPKPVAPDSDDNARSDKSFLYATYIHSNLTGVTNMRQSGTYNSAVIAAIPTNSQVFVLEKGGTYYKVRYNSSAGYVPKWALKAK